MRQTLDDVYQDDISIASLSNSLNAGSPDTAGTNNANFTGYCLFPFSFSITVSPPDFGLRILSTHGGNNLPLQNNYSIDDNKGKVYVLPQFQSTLNQPGGIGRLSICLGLSRLFQRYQV